MKLIKFYSKTCVPCKAMSPIVEKTVQAHNLDLIEIDVQEQPEKAAEYGVRGVPTVVLLGDNSEVIAKFVGMNPNLSKEIESYV